jgi:hypothetical protein
MTNHPRLELGEVGNAWLMTLLGLGLGPETAAVTAVVWALAGCLCAASVCVARRAKADWKQRQLRADEPLIVPQPLNRKQPTILTAGLLPPMARFPVWMVPYAQLLALGPFDARMQWTVPVDGAGWLPAVAKMCRVLLLADPTGTWGPVERGQGWRGASPIAPWLEAGDETTDERIFWLTVLGFPLLLLWALRVAAGNDHTTLRANMCVEAVAACSLPAWRVLFMPIGGVCPQDSPAMASPDVELSGSSAGVHGGPIFSGEESMAAPRCWQRDGGQALSMAVVGATMLLPCWLFGLVFASRAETMWHGAGRSVYVSTAAADQAAEKEDSATQQQQEQNKDDDAEDDEKVDVSAHPLDRFPCRVHYAIYRTQLLSLATVLSIGLHGAGVGPPILVVGCVLALELCYLLWRKPYQHRALNYVKALIVLQAFIITIAALIDVSASGNIDPSGHGVSSELLLRYRRRAAADIVSVISLMMWSIAGIGLIVHLIFDYKRRWRLHRQVQTISNATKAIGVIKAFGAGAGPGRGWSTTRPQTSSSMSARTSTPDAAAGAHGRQAARPRSRALSSRSAEAEKRPGSRAASRGSSDSRPSSRASAASVGSSAQQPRPPSRGVVNPRRARSGGGAGGGGGGGGAVTGSDGGWGGGDGAMLTDGEFGNGNGDGGDADMMLIDHVPSRRTSSSRRGKREALPPPPGLGIPAPRRAFGDGGHGSDEEASAGERQRQRDPG